MNSKNSSTGFKPVAPSSTGFKPVPPGQGAVNCQGYGATLTPWSCIENQLSLYCLPGWPCHECEGVGITVALPKTVAGRRDACPTKPKTIPKDMTRAVAASMGLI